MTTEQQTEQQEAPSPFPDLMAEVMSTADRFGHRQHVHLTYLAVRRYGTATAIDLISDGIQTVARYAGAPQKYNATVSRAWVELVGHHAEHFEGADGVAGAASTADTTDASADAADTTDELVSAADATDTLADTADMTTEFASAADTTDAPASAADFDAFADHNAALLDKRLLTRFYRPATLAGAAARSGWVEPDLAPFPWESGVTA